MKENRLKGKTIFDFCNDEKILNEITMMDCSIAENVEYYKKSASQLVASSDLVKYAIQIKDKKLEADAKEYFYNLQKSESDRDSSYRKKGIIAN